MKTRLGALLASAALCLALAGPAAAQLSPIVHNAATYGVSVATATDTQLIAANGTKTLYVTFAHLEAAGADNITFEYGTGSNCATGKTAIGGAISLTAQTGFAGGAGVGPIIVVPAGKALCLATTTTAQISGWLTAAAF